MPHVIIAFGSNIYSINEPPVPACMSRISHAVRSTVTFISVKAYGVGVGGGGGGDRHPRTLVPPKSGETQVPAWSKYFLPRS